MNKLFCSAKWQKKRTNAKMHLSVWIFMSIFLYQQLIAPQQLITWPLT